MSGRYWSAHSSSGVKSVPPPPAKSMLSRSNRPGLKTSTRRTRSSPITRTRPASCRRLIAAISVCETLHQIIIDRAGNIDDDGDFRLCPVRAIGRAPRAGAGLDRHVPGWRYRNASAGTTKAPACAKVLSRVACVRPAAMGCGFAADRRSRRAASKSRRHRHGRARGVRSIRVPVRLPAPAECLRRGSARDRARSSRRVARTRAASGPSSRALGRSGSPVCCGELRPSDGESLALAPVWPLRPARCRPVSPDPAIVDAAVEPFDIPFKQGRFDVLFQAQHVRQQLVEEYRRRRQPQPAQMGKRAVDDGVGADVEKLHVHIAEQSPQIERALRVAKRDVENLVRDQSCLFEQAEAIEGGAVEHRIAVGHDSWKIADRQDFDVEPRARDRRWTARIRPCAGSRGRHGDLYAQGGHASTPSRRRCSA